MKQKIYLLMALLLCVTIAWSQSKNVSGKVVSSLDNDPLIGVSVLVKGTTQGALTDVNGNYSISVDQGSTLTFSYIGFISVEIPVGNQSTINVSMQEFVEQMDEVVVIGYGTARKSDVTGAMARADLAVMENSPNVNLAQVLKGIVPGLNIGSITTAGGNPSITIRGRNTISGSQDPLIVLDGVIYRGQFTDINPNDVESVDVLKDASSTAIYGSQGANGVILITTKRSGRISKPIISYSGQLSHQRLMKDLKPLDAEGYIQQLKDCFISESRMGTNLTQPNPDFNVALKFKDPVVTDGYLKNPMTNTNWWDLLSNSFPYIQNHNVSIRGRSEATNYFLSFGYTDQKNLVQNDKYNRYSFRINLETNITDWFKLGTQSYYNISDFSGNSPSFSNLLQIPALVTPYNEDGSIKTQHYLGYINPLLNIDTPNENTRSVLSGTFFGEISIPWIKGLSYRVNYSRNWVTSKLYNFDPYANSLTGAGRKYHTDAVDMTFDNIVTYKNDFGKHSVNATFVYGVESREYSNTDARANIFTDQTLIYNYLQAGQSDQNDVRSDAWKESSLYSMGRLVYTYNNRYIFTGTVRRDGFSGFGKDNKFGVFPSAAIAWRLSEENFIKDKYEWIDNLKLRLSYGQGGNRTVGRYATLATMSTSGGYVFGDGGTGELAQNVNRLANSKLKWEATTSTNIGLDFSFLRGRLSGTYEYYMSSTSGLLYNVNYPRINGTGTVSIPTNIGKMENRGHELTISGIPVKTRDFMWDLTFNFSQNKNKVVSILGPGPDGIEEDLVSSNIFIGKSLDPVYDYNIIGMWQVEDYNAGIIPTGFTYGVYKIEDLNGDGRITAGDDRKILGYSVPLYRFSIINAFRYKGFELRAMINSIQGGKDYYLGQPANIPIRDHLQNWVNVKFDYWTPENPNAKYRQLGEYNNTTGNAFGPYVSRSFIRLQDLSLSYNLPSTLLKGTFISKARIYINATNLLTFTKWDGWDPEAGQGLGYDFLNYNLGGYPTMKSYSVGLNFDF